MHSNRSHDVRRTRSAALGGSCASPSVRLDEELELGKDELELVELDPLLGTAAFLWFNVACTIASIMFPFLFNSGLLADQGVPCNSMTK